MRRAKVRVTADHIAKGARVSECGCPVARALNAALGCRGATVDGGRLEVSKGGRQLVSQRFPVAVSRFVTAFDNGQPVKPFTFTVRAAESRKAGRL
jgi:hypothetical protein